MAPHATTKRLLANVRYYNFCEGPSQQMVRLVMDLLDNPRNGMASPSSSSLLLLDDRLIPLRWLSLQRSGCCLTSSEYHLRKRHASHTFMTTLSVRAARRTAKGPCDFSGRRGHHGSFDVINGTNAPVSNCPSMHVKTVAVTLLHLFCFDVCLH